MPKKLWLPALALLAGALSCKAPKGDGDVRGDYAITYDDSLTITVDIDGVVQTKTAKMGDVLDFGTYQGQPLTLDLAQFCARTDVACPSKVFWSKVGVDEVDPDAAAYLHTIQVVDDQTPSLPLGQLAPSLGGVSYHPNQGEDDFVVGLGASAGSAGDCAALSVSLATGRFSHAGESVSTQTVGRDDQGRSCDLATGGATCHPTQVTMVTAPDGAEVDGIKNGQITLGWLGACVFGKTFAVAAAVTISTGFSGTRTGDFDAPAYQSAPAPILDGGLDALPPAHDGGSNVDLD
jgi:hypothetical protein